MNARSFLALVAMLCVAIVVAAGSGLAAGQGSAAEPPEVQAASTLTIFYSIADASISDLYPNLNYGSLHQLGAGAARRPLQGR